ncbi:MAG: hypothetical protein O7E52_07940 [Candidatus Poribacteria bacterium]|nr:hypothetical protein [Candidatus Poribacteria bacterium]
MTRYITIKKLASISGYSDAAIRTKICRGVWLKDRVWIRAPDGRVLIDIEGYEQWATGRESAPVGAGAA